MTIAGFEYCWSEPYQAPQATCLPEEAVLVPDPPRPKREPRRHLPRRFAVNKTIDALRSFGRPALVVEITAYTREHGVSRNTTSHALSSLMRAGDVVADGPKKRRRYSLACAPIGNSTKNAAAAELSPASGAAVQPERKCTTSMPSPAESSGSTSGEPSIRSLVQALRVESTRS